MAFRRPAVRSRSAPPIKSSTFHLADSYQYKPLPGSLAVSPGSRVQVPAGSQFSSRQIGGYRRDYPAHVLQRREDTRQLLVVPALGCAFQYRLEEA